MKIHTHILPVLAIALLLSSCSANMTTDPKKAFENWTGVPPRDDVKVSKGKWMQRGNAANSEYAVYLDMTLPKSLVDTFRNALHLVRATDFHRPEKAPDWFKAEKGWLIWKPAAKEGVRELICLEDSAKGRVLLFDYNKVKNR